MAQSHSICQCAHAPPSAAFRGLQQQRRALKSENNPLWSAWVWRRVVKSQALSRRALQISGRQSNNSGKSPGDPEPAKDKDAKKGSVNWDGAWSSFRKTVQGGQKQMESYVERPRARPPPKFAKNEAQDESRRIENSALNVWTDERFFKAGVVVVGLFLIFVVVVIGPPPRH